MSGPGNASPLGTIYHLCSCLDWFEAMVMLLLGLHHGSVQGVGFVFSAARKI
jgi:hypothetical protein